MRTTYPKENKKKLNEVIRDLKALLRQKEKEIQFLRAELNNITKPKRDRPVQVERTLEEWRKGFLKRFKKEVLGEKG